MRLERSLPLLALLLCAVRITAQQDDTDTEVQEEFLVEISGTTVTITCPLSEESNIAWEITGTKPTSRDRKYVIENHDSSPANVSCASGGKKHEMYLNVRAQKMQRPPPVPNPDYEPIRKGQREVYAGLEPRGF
nr:T-cell surface glycoprotein CD3 epsilon chain isoform X2 [Columba livia]